MAQLVQCDVCGNVVTEAAEIVIHLDNLVKSKYRRHYGPTINSINAVEYPNTIRRDACKDCIDKFLEPKIKPLMITVKDDEL